MKYVRKPTVIEAFQWNAGVDPNPKWVDKAVKAGIITMKRRGDKVWCDVRTKNGMNKLYVDDYLIYRAEDDIYPVTKDVFEELYEKDERTEKLIANQNAMGKDSPLRKKTTKKVVKKEK